MIVRPGERGEEGYWIVETGPLTTEEVRSMIAVFEADGWELGRETFPSEFQ